MAKKKSRDTFITWQDWAIYHKNENFTSDFKIGNSNDNYLKDSDELHVEFEGVLCGNENELQKMLNDAYVNSALCEITSHELTSFNHIDFVSFVSGLNSRDTVQLYNPQSIKCGARRRSFIIKFT